MSNTRVRGAAAYWPSAGLLGRVDDADRAILMGLGHGVTYPAGQITIREADTSDFALLLLGGMVKVTAHAQDGREALLAVRMAGDLVGEFAGIDGQPRVGTVTACGRVLARYILRAELLDCTERHPAIGRALSASVVAKLRTATGRIVDYTGCDVLGRLARILHHLAVTYGRPDRHEAQLPLSQPEMATLVGAAESSIHKALRALRASGAVTTGYRRITILDLDRLARIAADSGAAGAAGDFAEHGDLAGQGDLAGRGDLAGQGDLARRGDFAEHVKTPGSGAGAARA